MLTIIADIRARPGKADFVRGELVKLVAPTLAEDGCIQYDLHQDDEDPAHFVFYESWESRELWQAHMESPHLQAWKKVADEVVEAIEIYEMTRIG